MVLIDFSGGINITCARRCALDFSRNVFELCPGCFRGINVATPREYFGFAGYVIKIIVFFDIHKEFYKMILYEAFSFM